MSFDLLLEPDLYVDVDVDDVIGYDLNWWRGNVDHESASWSKDLVGHESLTHVVQWDMSLFWALKTLFWAYVPWLANEVVSCRVKKKVLNNG